MKIEDSMAASIMVNQAPVGTLVSAEERYTPSRQPKTRKKNITIRILTVVDQSQQVLRRRWYTGGARDS